MYTSARVSLVSLTRQHTHHPTSDWRVAVLEAVTDTSTISVTPPSPLVAPHRAASCSWARCCRMNCTALTLFLGHQLHTVAQSQNIQRHINSQKTLGQCVQCVFFNDWMLWLKNNCASVFCRKLFRCFPVTKYIYIYIVCIFCNFVTWCILYFLCYNWYFVLCFVWLVKDALT